MKKNHGFGFKHNDDNGTVLRNNDGIVFLLSKRTLIGSLVPNGLDKVLTATHFDIIACIASSHLLCSAKPLLGRNTSS